MKKLLFATLALAAAAGLRAEEAKSSYSVTTDFTYTTQYFFRGVKNQDSAFQPSVTYTQGGFSGGIWTSQALDKRSTAWAQGKEYDFFAGYTLPVAEKYSFAVGGTYYCYPSARPSLSEAKKTYEGSLAFSGPVGPLTGKLSGFHDFKLDSNTVQLDLGYSIPLSNDGGSFDVGVYYGRNDIGDGDGDLPGTSGYLYKYYGVDVGLTGKLSDKLTVKVAAHWTNVSDLPHADTNVWLSVGLTVAL